MPLRLDQIDQLDMLTEEPADEQPDVAAQLPPQTIEPGAFAALYDKMLADGLVQRPSVLAVLRAKRYRLDANKWIHTVQNEYEQALLEEMRDTLVPHLRKALLNPTLQLMVEVDASVQPLASEQVLTNEDRLRMLESKNPYFKAFLERFTAVVT